MKIEYLSHDGRPGRRGKYPWRRFREIGDYFDVPPGSPGCRRGVRNAAHLQGALLGLVFRTFTLESGAVRVMLVDIEDGGAIAPLPSMQGSR